MAQKRPQDIKPDNLSDILREKWTHLDERDGEFGEAWVLQADGHKLKVEINRPKKQVRIYAETATGDRIESSITNGIVIEERDLSTNTRENLIEEFTELGRYLSAIPDAKLIRLIGGNYGVISEFIRTVQKYAGKDMAILKAMLMGLVGLPLRLLSVFRGWFRDVFSTPRVPDVIDAAAVISGGYLAYLVNFDYALAGVTIMSGAVLTGYLDWFVRRKAPYVLKVVITFIPAVYLVTIGFRYQ